MKKEFILVLIIFLSYIEVHSQSIGIGTNTPNINAKLDIVDSAKGILIPRIKTSKRIQIANVKGLMVYDTDTNTFWYNDGVQWLELLVSQDKKILTKLYLSDSF